MYQASEHSGPVVTSPKPASRQASAHKSRLTSLPVKLIIYSSAFIIIALFLTITATNLLLAKSYYQNPEEGSIGQRLAGKVVPIEAQLDFFQQIVDHVASQPTTQDILEYRDETGAQAWALQMRRFLPQALGVAILANDGKVLGEPADQQLGPQCLTDLARLSQREAVNRPPVHREPGNTAHYDLTAPVLDEAENPVGMLFVSFGLDSLKPLLRNSLSSDQHVELKDGQGKTISQWGVPQQDDNARRLQLPVGGSDWTVTLTEPNGGSPLSFISLAIFNVSAFLLTVGVIAFLMRYAMRSFGADFAQVKTLLNGLAQGEKLAEELPTPQLRETAEMFPAITHIRRDIDKKVQLLQNNQLNDELTGLPNRRQFNNEFARAYDFARRGTLVCVTLLHIDGLDKLGDNQREQVLKILGKTLKAHSRKVDHSARLDEERFAMLLFGMKAEGATPFLERMLRNFQERQTEHPALPDNLVCSLQCGYTLIHPHRDGNAAEVLKRAETALQAAQSEADRSIIAA